MARDDRVDARAQPAGVDTLAGVVAGGRAGRMSDGRGRGRRVPWVLAHQGDACPRPRAGPDDVAEAPHLVDAAGRDVGDHRPQAVEVSVYVGDHRDPHDRSIAARLGSAQRAARLPWPRAMTP